VSVRHVLMMAPLTIVVIGMGAKWWWDVAALRGYDSNQPLNPRVERLSTEEGQVLYRVEIDSARGERVPALLAVSGASSGPHPCVVFLHGIGQEKEFLNEIAGLYIRNGFAIIIFDQLGRGERKPADEPRGLAGLWFLRRRCCQTVLDTRRIVDYLTTRNDIASDQVFLIGASLGAIIGATALSEEPRFRAGVFVYGGGDLPELSAANDPDLGRPVVRWIVGMIMKPIEPTQHIAGAAPRPILMQHGPRDQIIPSICAKKLYDAAREPKRLVWYDSDHIGLDREVVLRVIHDHVEWIKEQGAARARGELRGLFHPSRRWSQTRISPGSRWSQA